MKLLLILLPVALSGCLWPAAEKKPVAAPVADPLEGKAPPPPQPGYLAPSAEPPKASSARNITIAWSAESGPPVVELEVSAEPCEEEPREASLASLYFERTRTRAASRQSFCVLTNPDPQWALVSDEPGGWHSSAGWPVPAGSRSRVARLVFRDPQGQLASLVASASLFCPGEGDSRCLSVFSAQLGGHDAPAGIALHFSGRGLTHLWWGLGAPALAQAQPEQDLSAVEDLSQGDAPQEGEPQEALPPQDNDAEPLLQPE